MENSDFVLGNVEQVGLDALVPAEWNYKTDGTEEEIAKLIESIKKDNSAGVMTVREVNGELEVIDGNHRLVALQKMGVTRAWVENLGVISDADAVTVAMRRNHQWFRDDLVALGLLVRDTVMEAYDMKELEKFMPMPDKELERIAKLADFDWEEDLPPERLKDKTLQIKVIADPHLMKLWNIWRDHLWHKEKTEDHTHVMRKAFMIALNASGLEYPEDITTFNEENKNTYLESDDDHGDEDAW